ncbi:hypothetical protein [Cryobacterium arcticum]|uniref:Uncharacterized protein n=1 Tax=Cryobacterium arcticum TaxID=670052 RepID=A0A317ZMG1_9MICO|nr:hypothetical protein [Cryobacterium arcticum]PXA67078.1 hypothetical protein CTB96_09900 [Cryobacterium arcticum]
MPPVDFSAFSQAREQVAGADQQVRSATATLSDLVARRTQALRTGAPQSQLDIIKTELASARQALDRLIIDRRDAGLTLGGILEATLFDPEDPIRSLPPHTPVALFPIRIETRFLSDTQMQIRVYPDQIHIHQHNPDVTAAEAALAISYWNAVWANSELATDFWSAISAEIGPERARYVVDRFTPEGLDNHDPATPPEFPDVEVPVTPVPRPPTAGLLPTRWHVKMTASNGEELHREWFATAVADELRISPLGEVTDIETPGVDGAPEPAGVAVDESVQWLVDFTQAEKVGMAHTLTLPAGKSFQGGVQTLVVVGVDTTRSATESAQLIASHLADHAHSDGFGLLENNIPTNNSAGGASDYEARNRDRSRTVAPLARSGAPGIDLVRVLTAFGTPARAEEFRGVPGSSADYETTVGAMHTALWGASFGFYFGHMLSPLASESTAGNIRALVQQQVRPAGPYAAIRVGRQPYGILPVLPSRGSVNRPGSLDGGFDAALPEILQRLRTFVEFSPIHNTDGEVSSISTLDALPNLTHQPPDTSSSDVLARILKLGPLATRLSIRPSASSAVFANSNKASAEAVKAHQDAVNLMLAHLLGITPTVLAINGQRPALFDLVVLRKPTYSFNGLPWVAADLDSPDVVRVAVEKMKLRVADASHNVNDAAKLLTVAHGDAASIFEGLLLLSGAFDYWQAGERHTHDLLLNPTSAEFQLNTEFLGLATTVAPSAATAAIETPRQLFQLAGPLTDNLPLLEFITNNAHSAAPARAMRDVQAFSAALDALATRPPREVDHALRGLLDLGSHRLDAFITAVATRRLETIRSQQPNGTLIGGYGIVHDLYPESTPDSEGYLHLPSADHAAAASILRASHIANRADDPRAFAIRLTSERVRGALGISEGMTQGQPPSALLGYRFERWLIEDRLRAKYITWFRKIAPHPFDGTAATVASDAIPAHDVVDGVALAALYLQRPEEALDRITAAGAVIAPSDRTTLLRYLGRLADLFDAMSDLWTTEAVYQLVRGNAARSAAASAVIDRQERPPEPQSILTSRGATGYAQRMLWLANDDVNPAWPTDLTGQIGVGANALAASVLGDPARFSLAVYLADDTGNPHEGIAPLVVSLADLGFSPLHLVLASQADQADESSALEAAVADFASAQPGFGEAPLVIARESSAGGISIGMGKLVALLDAAYHAIVGRPAVTRRDLLTPSGPSDDGIDLAALQALASQLHAAVIDARATLGGAFTGDAITDRAKALAGMAACRTLLMRVPPAMVLASPSGENVGDVALLTASRNALRALDEVLGAWDRTTATDADEKELARIRSVFGKDFPVLLDTTLPPEQVAEWQATLGDQDALRGGQGRAPLTRWRRQMAMVRAPMRALMDALDAAALTGDRSAGENLSLAQFPHVPGAIWVGLPVVGTDEESVNKPTVSMSAVVLGAFDPTRPVRGILVDEWTEAIPERQTATSVSFQYDAPASRPPQAILLGVTPAETERWSTDLLVDIVTEAFDLARLRLVAPNQMPGAGAVLPTTFLPHNLSQETASWDFIKHLDINVDLTVLGKLAK